jgi:DNA processing protein
MMTPSELRVLHTLASKFFAESLNRPINFDFSKIAYDRYTNFPDLVNYLKGHFGASNLPDEKSWNNAFEVVEKHNLLGIEMIAISDPEYPKYLRNIDNAPVILYLRGNRSMLRDLPGVSVVGTREVTANGAKIAERISEYLASNGWVIVSGLARGVDAIAHQACLNVNGKTIAVLANGLDEPQPKQNAELGYKILESGGAWVSEHPVGVKVEKRFFVQRNRIQLGLSAGSVIIEAGLKSGTMTQAEFCIKQKRPLFAVVPETAANPLGLFSEGTSHMVATMGANPLKNRDDYPNMMAKLNVQRSMMHSL